MIEHGLPEDRERIVRSLQGDIMKNAHAKCICSIIKKCLTHMIEHGLPEDRERIVRSLQTAHMIEHGLPEDRERIVRSLQGDIMKNAHAKCICSIIEKCLTHMIEHGLPEDRERIVRSLQVDIIRTLVLTLATDQYGSYVIEGSYDHFGHGSHGLPEDRERIVRSLQGDIMKNAHENTLGVGDSGFLKSDELIVELQSLDLFFEKILILLCF
ncbi:hypothetical protein GPALN_006641 [Globodera pallida]|nr:hypothetical protein GPALN_006641 [Globodera pallida]